MEARVPFQFYLSPEAAGRLARTAKRRGVSKAALVREYVGRGLAADVPRGEDPALAIVGLGRSGRRDVSSRHDEYLAARPGRRREPRR